MRRKRVAVIFGGPSTEHQVSLQSAKNVIQALDPARYEAVPLGIDPDGRWAVRDPAHFLLHADDPARIALAPSTRDVVLSPGSARPLTVDGGDGGFDVAFPLVHGHPGEDGTLQGLLRMADLPFVGSDVLGSALCMDKDVAKRLLRDAGIAVTPWIALRPPELEALDAHAVVRRLGLPLFVKPASQGSSVGVSRVETADGLHPAVAAAFAYDDKVLVETAVTGREIECAVLDGSPPRASACGEIVPHHAFYSYESKYLDADGASLAIPADLPETVAGSIRELALRAFAVLECRGLARVDVFLAASGQVLVNEVNTLPGFTSISMYPKLWEASGLSYRELVGTLVELACARHDGRRALSRGRIA